MTHAEWNNYRRADGSINLLAVWEDTYLTGPLQHGLVAEFFRRIEGLQKIRSRQAAAIAITLAEGWRPPKELL